MGWAGDAFWEELCRASGVPSNATYIRSDSTGIHYSTGRSSNYSTESYSSNNGREKEEATEWEIPPVKLKEYRTFYEEFPTPEQVKALNFITNYTGLLFEGKTKKEARQFISENIEFAREVKNGKRKQN